MIRLGVIFSLVFESLVLLCCGQMAPMAQAASQPTSCCSIDSKPQADAGCCCCEETTKAPAPKTCSDGVRGTAGCAPRCECPITLGQPRVPASPDRRPKTEAAASIVLAPEVRTIAFPFRAIAVIRCEDCHPPPIGGRLACALHCLWTI
ncbi:MAG: hypothetical protein JSS51_04285 [Planctomycetes bacterium]|nr:hypothetical protein [Planctomycetota bacterium]